MSFSKKLERTHKKSFVKSLNAALEGVVHTLRAERNMRIHFIIGFFVLMGGIYLNLSYLEIILLFFAITFVLITEMVNTAIEYLADVVAEEEFLPPIKIVKDIAAGAVFVATVNAGLTGYLLISSHLKVETGRMLLRIKQSSWHVASIALIACVGLVLLIKIARGEKMLLRGGMPSGHAAVAFALWMIISLLSLDPLISVLVFLLAAIVARSRLLSGIHSAWEVVAGAFLGALTALLIFQVLS